ncbi:MAG: hypothetical protein K2H35_07185, partial [Muribaculaceae bacterium]|nr:hypothetical protein [Muribaculaceae bacterium]
WWATDRHVLPGNKIMLYVFMLPDGRKNFEGEDDDKRARGILSDVRVTWFSPESESIEDDENDDEDTSPAEISEEDKLAQQRARERSYIEKAAEIKKIKPGQHARRKECMIPVAPGRYIYSPEEATNAQEKALIENYINAEKEYSTLKNELDKLRREYSSSPGKALGEKILEMENAEVKMRNSLTQILSQFYQQYKKNGR